MCISYVLVMQGAPLAQHRDRDDEYDAWLDEEDEAAAAEAVWAEEAKLPLPLGAAAAAAAAGATEAGAATAAAVVGAAGALRSSRLLKGEGVDVSLPTRRDVNLQMWCQGEAAEPGSFVRKATLRGGSDRTRNKATQQEQDKANADAAAANAGAEEEEEEEDEEDEDEAEVSLLVESIDALILEQRDLTFGKRAQTL
jgi:hypothetical protein